MIPWVPLGNVIFSLFFEGGKGFAQIAQLVEQWTENPRVAGSIPALGTICGHCTAADGLPSYGCGCPTCGHSSSGRAPPCQGGGSEFEPRCPLQLRNSHHRSVSALRRKLRYDGNSFASPPEPLRIPCGCFAGFRRGTPVLRRIASLAAGFRRAGKIFEFF